MKEKDLPFDQYKHDQYREMLLPCPFCGEEEFNKNGPYVYQRKEKNFPLTYVVSCTCCGCEPSACVETVREAIDFWNTRKPLILTCNQKTILEIAKLDIIEKIRKLEFEGKKEE